MNTYTIKQLDEKQFTILFSIAFDANIENILLNRNKNPIGGGFQFIQFYQQIEKLTNSSSDKKEHNELECILKFFDIQCYNKIEFPRDGEILLSLLRFTQSHYKPLHKIQKFTETCIDFLGKDVFCETVLNYIEKIPYVNTDKNKVFINTNKDIIHESFILAVLNIIHKKHKSIDKQILEKQLTQLLSGRINNVANIILYKKLEDMDNYIETSSFSQQLYEYHQYNTKFFNSVKKYKSECLYKNLDQNIEIKLEEVIKPKL